MHNRCFESHSTYFGAVLLTLGDDAPPRVWKHVSVCMHARTLQEEYHICVWSIIKAGNQVGRISLLNLKYRFLHVTQSYTGYFCWNPVSIYFNTLWDGNEPNLWSAESHLNYRTMRRSVRLPHVISVYPSHILPESQRVPVKHLMCVRLERPKDVY